MEDWGYHRDRDQVATQMPQLYGIIRERQNYNAITLPCAINFGHFLEVQAFLSRGIDPNGFSSINGYSLLEVAVCKQFSEIVEILSDYGADVNGNLNTDRNCEITRMLLDYGANTNIITAPIWGSCTPLHEAVERSHHDIVTMLLRAGANPNIRNNTGDTALHICRDIDSANVLLDYHADLTITNNLGFTVLHSAAEKGYTHNIVMLLCTRGVNIDTQIAADIQSHRAGYIALHIAAALGHLETVRTLLTNGADVTVEGVDGYTAMHLASRSHHFAIVTLMRSFLVNGYLLK